jgi:hypothetical protein
MRTCGQQVRCIETTEASRSWIGEGWWGTVVPYSTWRTCRPPVPANATDTEPQYTREPIHSPFFKFIKRCSQMHEVVLVLSVKPHCRTNFLITPSTNRIHKWGSCFFLDLACMPSPLLLGITSMRLKSRSPSLYEDGSPPEGCEPIS